MSANAAWLTCAVIAYNLSRAAGVLAGGKLVKARTTTIRAKLINIPARIPPPPAPTPCTYPRTPAASNHSWPCSTPPQPLPRQPDPPIRPPLWPDQHTRTPGHPDHRSGDTPGHNAKQPTQIN